MSEDLQPTRRETGMNRERDVPYAQRYTAAWAEISQRVAARQQVYSQFATVSVTAIVAVLSAWAKSKDWAGHLAEWGAAGLVVYSWVFAFWIRNNHAVVGLLGVYCKALEGGFKRDGEPDPDCAWHTDAQGWIVVARRYGRYSDWAAVILAVLSSLPALVFGGVYYRHSQAWPAAGLLTAGALGLGAAIFLYWNRLVRDQIANLTPDAVAKRAEKWKPR